MSELKGSPIIIPVNWIQYHSGIPTQSKDIRVSQLLPCSQAIIFDVALKILYPSKPLKI